MTLREPWEEVRDAEDLYFARRVEMFAAGKQEQLRLALADPVGAGMALRILRDADLQTVMDLFDAVFARATTTHGPVQLAREVLARLDAGWLFRALGPVIERRLSQPGADWEDFQRIAEVLHHLDQHAHLNTLVVRAERSDDPDIVEVAEVYRTVDG